MHPIGRTLPGPRAARSISRLMGVLSLAIAGLAGVPAAAGQAPSTLLLHAQLAEALAFASETARQRGWAVVDSAPTSVTFEQPLDPDPDGTVALLRITATGAESPGGVTVSLGAQEVRPASGATLDVTQRYRDNLINALDSLASKWGLRPVASSRTRIPPAAAPAPQPSDVTAPMGASPATPALTPTPAPPLPRSLPPQTYPATPFVQVRPASPTETPAPRRQVGTWAYYAERHAEGRGCTLGDQGAVLEDRTSGGELHRVYCADGRQMLVRCAAGSCTDAR
jgi:hypothetical protein